MAVQTQKFTGDADQLFNEVERLRKQQVGLEDQIARTQMTSERGANKTQQMVRRGLGDLKQMASAWVSVRSAIQLAIQSQEHFDRLSEERRQKSLTVGQAQGSLIRNLFGATSQQKAGFIKNVDQLAGDLKIPRAQFTQAASNIVSATGGDLNSSLEILGASGQVFTDNPEELVVISGALGDVQKATGDTNAKRNLALLLSLQSQARFADASSFKNVAPALAAAGTFGGKDQRQKNIADAAALVALLTTETGDTEANLSSSAAIGLMENLRSTGQKSLFDAILSGDGSFAEQGIPLKQREAVRQLLTKGSPIQQKFIATRGKISADPSSIDTLVDELINLTQERKLTDVERAAKSRIEQFQTGGGFEAQAREEFKQAIDKSSESMGLLGALRVGDRKTSGFLSDRTAGFTTFEAAVRQLQIQRRDIINPSLFGLRGNRDVEDISPEKQKAVELIDSTIESIERLEKLAAEREKENNGRTSGSQTLVHDERD